MYDRGELDLTNLPRFIVHLGERNVGLAEFVSELLDAGWKVIEFWGPEQMDVWSLELQSEDRVLTFGIERGYVDGVRLRSADGSRFCLLGEAMLGWARSCGAVLPLDDPDEFHPDVASNAWAVLDWVVAGNDEAAYRINAAWKEYRLLRFSADQRLGSEWLAEVKARGIRMIEEAAAPHAP